MIFDVKYDNPWTFMCIFEIHINYRWQKSKKEIDRLNIQPKKCHFQPKDFF